MEKRRRLSSSSTEEFTLMHAFQNDYTKAVQEAVRLASEMRCASLRSNIAAVRRAAQEYGDAAKRAHADRVALYLLCEKLANHDVRENHEREQWLM